MEIAALVSFLALIVSWMALPATDGRVVIEEPRPARARTAAAKA